MTTSAISGEQFGSRLGAAFDDDTEAWAAAERVVNATGIEPERIRVVRPEDPAIARKLEPETGGIAQTLVRAHVTLGAAGLILGLAIALLLIAAGIGLFALNPWYTALVFGFFGAVAGLLLGGLIALRPDHDRLIDWVRSAAGENRWLLLVHVEDRDQQREARAALRTTGSEVVGTL